MFSNKVSVFTCLVMLNNLFATFKSECTPNDDYTGIYGQCDKFLRCSNGVYFLFTCAPGTLFDYKRKLCDYPQNVACLGEFKTTFSTPILVSPSTTKNCRN